MRVRYGSNRSIEVPASELPTVGHSCRSERVRVELGTPEQFDVHIGGACQPDSTELLDSMVIDIHDKGCDKSAGRRPREVLERLTHFKGSLTPVYDKRHDRYKTSDGRMVEIPRHADELTDLELKSVMRQAGLEKMSIRDFLAVCM